MPKRSAGLLLYRRVDDDVQLLLVHPGGPYWATKDDGAWSVPKGEVDEGEELFDVAIREFGEELGAEPPDAGSAVFLGELRQPSGKLVNVWALESDLDVTEIQSNTFTMEWPPRSGRTAEFPEVDRAAWFGPDAARRKLLRGQVEFVERLTSTLTGKDEAQG
ncbi:MAG: NUDIX domain-containing protein [Actinomycetota bacterium]